MSSSIEGQHFETVIIGAGMAGLAAGIRLALAGKKVVILERQRFRRTKLFYSQEGRKFDVGLHAMTNYVPKGTRYPLAVTSSTAYPIRLSRFESAVWPKIAFFRL